MPVLRCSLAGLAASLALTLPTTLCAQSPTKDSVYLTDGTRLRVEVTAATVAQVTYNQDGAEATVEATRVARIDWHEPPDAYLLAQSQEQQGKFDEAANQYSEAADKSDRQPVREDAQFRAARAQALAGVGDVAKAAGAEKALRELLGATPESFHAREARLLLGRTLRDQDKAGDAVTHLAEMASTARTDAWGPMWEARIQLEHGASQLAAGDAGGARSAFESAVSLVEGQDDNALAMGLHVRAIVGQGETWLVEGKAADALSFFRRYSGTGSGDAGALRAAALTGEGQALLANAGDDLGGLRQAQTALAQAQVLDPGTQETSAKAMYLSGKVLLALGERERDARRRALAYFDSVVALFPATRWAAEARTELGQ
ncbi:MAG: tetratricopeptide repeat protein [Planctomycetota bacterium]